MPDSSTPNPVTAWVATIPDLPTDPTRRAMVIALAAVEVEISDIRDDEIWTDEGALKIFPHIFAARIALTDALFPPTPRAKEPVPDWLLQDLREKQRLCGAAMRKCSGGFVADRALAQHQLLDAILQQAVEVRS